MTDKAQLYEAAVTTHRRHYERTHTKPATPSRLSGLPFFAWFMITIGVSAALIAAIKTGGVFYHTAHGAPLLKAVVAMLAMVVIDASMGGLSFFWSSWQAKRSANHAKEVTSVLKFTLIFTFCIQIIGGVYSTLTAVDVLSVAVLSWLDVAIALATGLSAPIVALTVGHIVAVIMSEQDARFVEDMDTYNKAIAEYEQAVIEDFEANPRKWLQMVKAPATVQQLPASVQSQGVQSRSIERSNEHDGRSTGGYTVDAKDKVRAYIAANPDALRLSRRQLALAVGVSLGTAQAVVSEYTLPVNDKIEQD